MQDDEMMPDNPMLIGDNSSTGAIADCDFAEDGGSLWAFMPYSGDVHPEWLVLGKPHPDRAKQFKPFDALRGYDALVKQAIDAANKTAGEDQSDVP